MTLLFSDMLGGSNLGLVSSLIRTFHFTADSWTGPELDVVSMASLHRCIVNRSEGWIWV